MRRSSDEFERVAMPHAPSLLRSALRLTASRVAAEALGQETLLLAWRGFRQLEDSANVRAWLFRILIHAHYGQHRRQRSRVPTMELAAADRMAGASGSERLEVTQALDRLGSDHRTVLLLAVVEGFTCREIGEILAVPVGTVTSRLSRAREAMREALGEKAVR